MPYPTCPPRRGEIYWVDWNPGRGSEQLGRRPGVVISLDSFNATMSIVVVAAMTTEIKPAFRIAPVLPAGRPLKKAGQILPFQVQTIDQARLDGYMGMLDSSQIEDLKAALRTSWGL